MELLIKSLFYILLLLIASCGQNMDYLLNNPTKAIEAPTQNVDKLSTLPYKVSLTNGDTTDLASDNGKITLLIFGQDLCDVCGEETEEIVSSLQNKAVPSKINLLTVLVGTTLEDAEFWKEMFEVPWDVGFEEQATLFNKLCPLETVPCIIIHSPKDGILLRHHGKLSVEDIKSYTGEWY